MIAKTKSNQKNLNAALAWLKKYYNFNCEREALDGAIEEDSTLYKKVNRNCEKAWDKYEDYCTELPKYEVKRIEKSKYY